MPGNTQSIPLHGGDALVCVDVQSDLLPGGSLAVPCGHDVADVQSGKPLLETVMRGGRRLADQPTLESLRKHAAAELARLPDPLCALGEAPAYPVAVSESLIKLAAAVDRHTGVLNP